MIVVERHDVLRYGTSIYLVNCTVTPQKVLAGFGYFEANIPEQFPLRDITNNKLIVSVNVPDEVKNKHDVVVLGDYDSPIEFKRIS